MSDQSYKLAMVGREGASLLYKALGVQVSPAQTAEEAQEVVADLFAAKQAEVNVYAVVFVEECFFRDFSLDFQEKLTKSALPAVIAVPSPGDDNDQSFQRMKALVERAVGSDILN